MEFRNSIRTTGKALVIRRGWLSKQPSGLNNKTASWEECRAMAVIPNLETLLVQRSYQFFALSMLKNLTDPSIITILTSLPTAILINHSMRDGLEESSQLLTQFEESTSPATKQETTYVRLLLDLQPNLPNSLTDGTWKIWTGPTWISRSHGTGAKPYQDNTTFGDISTIITLVETGCGLKLLLLATASSPKATQ